MTLKTLLAATLLASGSAAYAAESRTDIATFAGGCFWCMEPPFDKLDGVISTTPGYIGGHQADPTYRQVSGGRTGHTEAVQIVYDTGKTSYEELLAVFWRNIDPTTPDRQFCDIGSQYRTGIFYHNETQRKAAEKSRKVIRQTKPFEQAIVTEITAASIFYPAEDYHQDYYLKNPLRYEAYRNACRRDQRLEMLWNESELNTGRPGSSPDVIER